MFTETFADGSWYVRLESDDWNELKGKRVRGHGKIVGWLNAEGENHPALVRTEDDSLFTPTELGFVEFDGRHGFVDIDTPKASA